MGARRRHPGAPGPNSSIPGGSGRTRLLAARLRDAIARPRPAGLGDRRCGAGRADGLASVLSKGHEPESGRALAPPAYRPVSRLARPQSAPSLRPWTVHGTNRTEFLVGFWELAPGWVWLLGPIVGVLAGLSIVMPARWFPRYVAALCAVGVLLWTQGNLLLADYGLLDGGGLDLASHACRTPFEAGMWLCVLLIAVIFADRVTRVAPVACVALVTLQATVLLVPVGRVATARRTPDDSHRNRVAVAAARDLRTLQHAQPHPHRARHVPDTHVRRHPGRRPARLRSRLAGLHVLRQSPRHPSQRR